jgi:DNA polymerase-1
VLKEDERDNALKVLYTKYVLRGKGDPMKFSDFFTPQMFPYCKPEIAKLYAAHDAKITYELFTWQLPYATKGHPKCEKFHLDKLADLIWQVEIPLIRVCQTLHRTGMFVDKDVARKLMIRYKTKYDTELQKLSDLVDAELAKSTTVPAFGKKAFTRGKDFNPNSNPHVKYLLFTVMGLQKQEGVDGTGKEVLGDINLPVTNQILKVRSLDTLISTFVDKLPNSTTPDDRIHAEFKQIGASTGRFSSANPNMQNIPSHAEDIRHMFRATPGYVMLSSDYSRIWVL